MPFNCRKSEQLSLILAMKEHHALQILKCCSEVLFLQRLPNGPSQNGVSPLGNLQTRRYQHQITVLCCSSDPARCTLAGNPQWWFSTLLTWIAATKRSKPLSLGWPLQLQVNSSPQPPLPWTLTEYRQGKEKQENRRNHQKLNSHKST